MLPNPFVFTCHACRHFPFVLSCIRYIVPYACALQIVTYAPGREAQIYAAHCHSVFLHLLLDFHAKDKHLSLADTSTSHVGSFFSLVPRKRCGYRLSGKVIHVIGTDLSRWIHACNPVIRGERKGLSLDLPSEKNDWVSANQSFDALFSPFMRRTDVIVSQVIRLTHVSTMLPFTYPFFPMCCDLA